MNLVIKVTGLRELRAALRELSSEDLKELRLGLKGAAEIVSAEAKLRANAFSFQASDTIRPGTSGNRAFVAGGGTKLRWYGWADFGSRRPRHGQPRSMGPWARSGPGPRGGRFIYPALASKRAETVDAVRDALNRAIERLNLG